MENSGPRCRELGAGSVPGVHAAGRAAHTQGEHHGQVPVAQALPRRAGTRQRGPDGPVDARRGRGPHPVHERLRNPAREHRRVRRRAGAVARRRVGPLRRRGAAAGDRRPVRRDEGPDRRLDGDRRRQLRARDRARRRAVGSARSRRRADPRMAGGPALHGCASQPSPTDRGRRRAARARPTGVERPRPSRCGLRDGRGRRTRGAHPGALRVGERVARRPHGVAHHGRVESVPRHDAVRRRRAATERSDSTPSRRPARSRAPTTRCASTSCARTPS